LPLCPHYIYNKNARRCRPMKKKKFYFTYEEWRLIIHALNEFRTSLMAEGRYTDTVDETLVKFMNAKTKKVKIS
jgi:hypothetical protein